MDILAPKLQWIGGRCYRINPTRDEPNGGFDEEVNEPDKIAQYIEQGKEHKQIAINYSYRAAANYLYYPIDMYGREDTDEQLEEYEIVLTESKRFKTTFHIPK